MLCWKVFLYLFLIKTSMTIAQHHSTHPPLPMFMSTGCTYAPSFLKAAAASRAPLNPPHKLDPISIMVYANSINHNANWMSLNTYTEIDAYCTAYRPYKIYWMFCCKLYICSDITTKGLHKRSDKNFILTAHDVCTV